MVKAAELLAAEGIQARGAEHGHRPSHRCRAIVAAARDTGAILTAEEHSSMAVGFGRGRGRRGRVPVPMKILGVPGIFAPTGSAEFLLDEFGMSPVPWPMPPKALIAEAARA